MSRPREQLYFAYGSNLWVQQMAARCPGSYYVGRAVLSDFRWQINERGYANVIPCSGYNVHGLIYKVNAEDESRLDRNEGVNSGAYSKSYERVILYAATPDLQLPTRRMIEDEGLAPSILTARHHASRFGGLEREPTMRANVLVYLSERYVQWYHPKDEYINRMNHGIRDAIALGIPADFFTGAVRPLIPNRPVSRRVQPRVVQRQSLAAPDNIHRHHRARSAPEEPRSRSTQRSQSRARSRSRPRSQSRRRQKSPDRHTWVAPSAPAEWSPPIYRLARSVSRGASRTPRDDVTYYYG